MEALRPRPLERIGVALEHQPADAEILNRALGLAQNQPGHGELVLLHVVDTPMTARAGFRDRRPGDRRRRALPGRGGPSSQTEGPLASTRFCCRVPTAAGEIVGRLKKEPVDLLVVGSHGHGLVRDLLLGQTVDKVRHGLEIPMMIARPPSPSVFVEPSDSPAAGN